MSEKKQASVERFNTASLPENEKKILLEIMKRAAEGDVGDYIKLMVTDEVKSGSVKPEEDRVLDRLLKRSHCDVLFLEHANLGRLAELKWICTSAYLMSQITNWNICTAMRKVAEKDYVDIMRFLKTLKSIASKDDDYKINLKWAFTMACSAGALNAMKLIHDEWKSSDIDIGLCWAAEYGKFDAVKQCMAWGATCIDDGLSSVCRSYCCSEDQILTNAKRCVELGARNFAECLDSDVRKEHKILRQYLLECLKTHGPGRIPSSMVLGEDGVTLTYSD